MNIIYILTIRQCSGDNVLLPYFGNMKTVEYGNLVYSIEY